MRHVNEIVLVGRLSGEPEWRPLPGGGHVVVWRLIVEHPGGRSPQDSIDTIRCVAFRPAIQEGIRGWRHGDLIEVRGSLRHRFWRGPSGPRGLYEVEAATAIRHRPAEAPGDPPGTAPAAGDGDPDRASRGEIAPDRPSSPGEPWAAAGTRGAGRGSGP